MTDERRSAFDEELERLKGLVTTLQGMSDDSAAKSAAQELVQVVISLHGRGLSDLLGILQEAGTQPADTVLPRLLVNPKIRGLLLLHDLHPEDLATRARQATERLRPHLGVQGVYAELAGVQEGVVRIRVSASGQKTQRPSSAALRRDIEEMVTEMAPDAVELVIEGLDGTSGANEAYVPLPTVSRAGAAGSG